VVGVRETGKKGKHRGTEGTEKRGREEKGGEVVIALVG
jgi:hypothetical protein